MIFLLCISSFCLPVPFCTVTSARIGTSAIFRGRLFSPEELVAMLLAECRDLAESFAGEISGFLSIILAVIIDLCVFLEQPVRDVIITVPPFWNQVERRAMAKAAAIADLNLLQLMNDNTAGKFLSCHI